MHVYLFVLGFFFFFTVTRHFDWTVKPVNQFSRQVNCAISCLVYSPYVCTCDNPLAEAHGLSSRTDARTTHYVTLT